MKLIKELFLLFLCLLIIISCSNKKSDICINTEIISDESLIRLDSRMLFSSVVNNSPGDGTDADVNPPRFRWFYTPPAFDMPLRFNPFRFCFQVSGDKEFTSLVVDKETEFNFYNELAPFEEGKEYYWRVGYLLKGEKEPSSWSKVFSVNIPAGTPKWDRTALINPDFGGHPRLLFREDQLAELKRIAKESPVFNNQIIPVANQMLEHKWWGNWPETDSDNPEYTYNYYFHLSQKLIQTAFAYLITGEEKYSYVLDIWKMIASYRKGGASSPEGMGKGEDADSEDNTSITEFMACVYDWFYGQLAPEERTLFEKSLEWRINNWMHEFRWGGAIFTDGSEHPKISRSSLAIGGAGHSWEGSLATFTASIALYEKSEIARRYFHWIANYLISVGETVAQNGGYDHGAYYGQSHLKWLVYQLMYLNTALPELELGKNPLYKQYGDFFTSLVPVGMEYSHFGRISQHGAGMAMRSEVFNLLAFLTSNGEFLQNWENIGGKENFDWRQWIHVAAPLQFRKKILPVRQSQTKFIFPATGFVMAHQYPPGESKAFQEGVGVIFCCRPGRGDEYNNENSFQLYAYGQHCNYGGHSGDENPYGFQTIAHNTILVDGIGQTITPESRNDGYRGAIIAYREGSNYTYWVGDATNAYPKSEVKVSRKGWSAKSQIDYDKRLFGEEGAPKVERFRRHMLFMRDKYLVVFDDLKTASERPSVFSWRYRVLPECDPEYNPQQGLLSYILNDVKVMVKHVASPELIEFEDLKGLDQFINPVTGNNYLNNNKYTALDMEDKRYREKVCAHNFWFTSKKAESDFHFLTVIYPVQPGTSEPEISRLDDYTVKIEKNGESDIISFDKNTKYPATLVVDLDAFRKPIQFEN